MAFSNNCSLLARSLAARCTLHVERCLWPMCVAFLSLDAELFSRLFTNVCSLQSATIAGATHTHTESHMHSGLFHLWLTPWPPVQLSSDFDSDLDSPLDVDATQCELRLDAVSNADLLINLTNSTLIFADFVRHTQMNLICLKRTEAEAAVGWQV